MTSSAAASSFERLALPWVALLVCACNVGSGTGTAKGIVSAPACGLDAEAFDLHPDFFAIDPTDDFAEITIQHGSDFIERSDALLVFINDTEALATARLGEPIAVNFDATDGVSMSLALNDTCEVDDAYEDQPVNYIAISGTITFSALYAPSVSKDAKRTTAVFEDVRFVDPNAPDERYAVLSGDFSFRYDRGQPAQRLP
jgi:hypothetical protein